MDGADPCRFLDWDSTFFGLRIAALEASTRDGATFAAALDWCRRQRIDCLYLLSDADDLATLRLAEEHRFRLVDVRLTYERRLAADRPAPPASATGADGGTIRTARASDVPALRAIAAESHRVSRFYADGRFDRARCDELYATWIEKSCAGWADAVFVADLAGAPVGYLSCHRREGGRGEIGLVGIAGAARGRGLGRDLVDRALSWFAAQDLDHVTVVTQARSLGAQRLYQSAGFLSRQVELWHHRWFESATPPTP